jgi:hypothetical protein
MNSSELKKERMQCGSYCFPLLCTDKPFGLKNILFVGNSLMFYNCGVTGMISGFAKEKGIPLVLTMVGIGGASLYWHDVKSYLRPNGLRSYSIADDGTNKVTFIKYPNGKIFDAVVLEDSSQGPIHPELNKLFNESAKKHCKDIRDSGARPYFMLTWAYKNKPDMTRRLAEATIQTANANNASVIPCGLAFERSLRDFPEIELIRSDNRHPTVAGTYLEAAVFFSSLTGISPSLSSFCGRYDDLVIPKSEAEKLQKVAWKTVKEFNHW